VDFTPDLLPSAPLTAALGELDPALTTALLTAQQLEQLDRYLALVAQYAAAVNLTGLDGPAELARELAAESLRLLAFGPLAAGALALDLGSGNGSPVIPLAIAQPQADFVAVELRVKRAAFLRQAKAALGLGNLRIEEMAAEDVTPGGHGLWDVITSRAFAPLPRLLPLARRLLGRQGELRGYLGSDTVELKQLAPEHGLRVTGLQAYALAGKPRHVYRLECA
jgi:16S rRNA (guanine527-N7)-methyltransferase